MSTDESITRFAQKHRFRAAAALVRIVNDEDASASARVSASQSILAYSDGRPSVSKLITAQDVVGMSSAQRASLWKALFDVETVFPDFILARINDAVRRAAEQLASGKPNKYTRGTPEVLGPHVVPSRPPAERRGKAAAATLDAHKAGAVAPDGPDGENRLTRLPAARRLRIPRMAREIQSGRRRRPSSLSHPPLD